ADNCTIQGNYIGTDVTGLNGLPNNVGGIVIENGSSGNRIGGSGAGERNIIAFNTGYGVSLVSAGDNQNLISRNSMFCNTGNGIELNGLGNGNQSPPVITNLTGAGVLGVAGANEIVELFYDSTCTASCQGKDYIATVVADGVGLWSYIGAINNGSRVVATATAVAPAGSVNNTSEFVCAVLLPVEDLVFSANRANANHVDLTWTTGQETDFDFFVVERSVDGLMFEDVGTVAGAAASGAAYGFADPDAGPERLFYRLKQVDLDGSVAFGEVVQVDAASAMPGIQLYDHPASKSLRFSVSNTQGAEVQGQLIDLQGKVVKQFHYATQAGNARIISISDLAPGVYHLSISTRNFQASKRVLVVGAP
ncbi:MAG: T9SS type A sorting domain-containing protein, partial [Bacteroidota bacterium]